MRYAVPCREYPDDAHFKTIATLCPRCGRGDCWDAYLRWEIRAGITLNQAAHAEVEGT